MKISYFLLIVLIVFSCKEKKKIPEKFNAKDLDFIYRIGLSSEYIDRSDNKPLKLKSYNKIEKEDEILYQNLMKEDFFEKEILIPEKFVGNTIFGKPYYLDDENKIIFLYNDFSVKLQKGKENFEMEKRLPPKKHGEVLLKDLDNDGIKEIVVYQKEGTYDYTYHHINVYSVFK